jgi:hypothetical protein
VKLLLDPIGHPERATQNRVIALFRDELGCPISARRQALRAGLTNLTNSKQLAQRWPHAGAAVLRRSWLK